MSRTAPQRTSDEEVLLSPLRSPPRAGGGAGPAQFAKAEDAIKYRQSALTVMSNHMGRLAAMAKGERPFDAASRSTRRG